MAIEFDSDQQYPSSVIQRQGIDNNARQTSRLSAFIIRVGLAKNEKQAGRVMLAIIAICLIVSGILVYHNLTVETRIQRSILRVSTTPR